MLATVRMTLVEQRAARTEEARRQVYLEFARHVEASYVSLTEPPTVERPRVLPIDLRHSLSVVELEGPVEVHRAAKELYESLQVLNTNYDMNMGVASREAAKRRFHACRSAFLRAAHAELLGR